MKKNIILIGFMGCGKTTTGIRLSYKLRKTFLDTDKYIEQKMGMRVSEIFEKYGEDYFRDLETQCLKDLLQGKSSQIISVGGGLPVRRENRELLKRLGTVIYLNVSEGELYDRLKEDTERPLLQCEDPKAKIRNLLKEREKLYLDAAHVVLDVGKKDTEEVVNAIADIVKSERNNRE